MKLLLGLVFLATTWHTAGAGPIPQNEYVAGVHRLRVAVDALGSPRPDRATRARLAAEAKRLILVRVPTGPPMNTGFRAIAAGLNMGLVGFARTRQVIDGLDNTLRATPVRGPSPGENQKLQSILAGPGFHPQVSPIDQFKDWLAGQINRFLGSLQRQAGGHPRSTGFVGLLALAIIVVLAILIGRATLSRVATETAAPLDSVKGLTASQALSRADELAATGDYLAALRTLFAATLLRLSELDYLELRVGMTNREYLRQLMPGPGAGTELKSLPTQRVERFERLMNQFEVAWYGGHPVEPATYRLCQALAGAVTGAGEERAA